jgi:hypothetical protein
MPSMTVTITDKTQPAFNLRRLIQTGSVTGATCAPAAGYPNAKPSCKYLSIQSDPSNGAKKIFRGDSGVKNDGTQQGKTLLAGDTDVMQQTGINDVFLDQTYVNTDTNGAIFNLEWSYA